MIIKYLWQKLFIISLSLFLTSAALADPAPDQTNITIPTPQTSNIVPALTPAAPDINAKGYVLLDANSGYVIAQKNGDQRMPPASLTKLMTLYIAADALKNGQINLDDKVRISKKAWQMGGSKMFIREGKLVPVELLIQGIIVASGNDATYAIAEYIGGNEPSFVTLMNQTASSLNMTNTHYKDSNGLPAKEHYSTPMDIAKLARAWIVNFPEYYPWFKQKWITYNGIKQPNRNRLLWRDPTVDGLKTGHTDAAGFCLVASAERDGMRLVTVVMGAPTDSARASDSEALLNYGFRFYETHKLYAANTPLITPRIWYAKNKTIALGLAQDLYITIPKGQYKNIKAVISITNTLKAPIDKGQNYGTVKILLNDKEITEQPLIALQDDPKGSFFSRAIDHVCYLFHGWFSSGAQS
jgi:D-alanyl-D-alanine carboxypeptidase (penicillin-binding protein 5/6)